MSIPYQMAADGWNDNRWPDVYDPAPTESDASSPIVWDYMVEEILGKPADPEITLEDEHGADRMWAALEEAEDFIHCESMGARDFERMAHGYD